MMRTNPRKVRKIGFILILVSIILFAVSVYFLSSGTSDYQLNIEPGKSANFTKNAVGRGDDLTYKVSFYQSVNITASLYKGAESPFSVLTYSHLPTGTNDILAPTAGNWTLQITNHGSYAVNLSVTFHSLTHNNVNIAPGGSKYYYDQSVSAQGSMDYGLSLNQVPSLNVTLIAPDGSTHAITQLSNSLSGSQTIIVPTSGTWTLQATDNGNLPVNISVSYGDVGLAALAMTVFGFVLLPCGIAFVGMYVLAVRREKKRKRLREFSE